MSEDNSIPKFIKRDYKVFISSVLTASGQFKRKSKDPQRIKIDFERPPLQISPSQLISIRRWWESTGTTNPVIYYDELIITRSTKSDSSDSPKRVFICPLWPGQPPDWRVEQKHFWLHRCLPSQPTSHQMRVCLCGPKRSETYCFCTLFPCALQEIIGFGPQEPLPSSARPPVCRARSGRKILIMTTPGLIAPV